MKALIKTNKQISVDQIIQKVLIRNNNKHYDYAQSNYHQLTPSENIWHYQLQEENLELQQKIQLLTKQFKRKHQQVEKHSLLEQQIASLKVELQRVIKSNGELQCQINHMRIKKSVMEDTIRNSLDQSVKKSHKNRQCLCDNRRERNKSISQISKLKYISQKSESPQKEILKKTQHVSINCHLESNSIQLQIARKQQHIAGLKKIINNQEVLLTQYQREIEVNKLKSVKERNKTMASATNLISNTHRISHTTFKPLFSPGTIVKMKKY